LIIYSFGTDSLSPLDTVPAFVLFRVFLGQLFWTDLERCIDAPPSSRFLFFFLKFLWDFPSILFRCPLCSFRRNEACPRRQHGGLSHVLARSSTSSNLLQIVLSFFFSLAAFSPPPRRNRSPCVCSTFSSLRGIRVFSSHPPPCSILFPRPCYLKKCAQPLLPAGPPCLPRSLVAQRLSQAHLLSNPPTQPHHHTQVLESGSGGTPFFPFLLIPLF